MRNWKQKGSETCLIDQKTIHTTSVNTVMRDMNINHSGLLGAPNELWSKRRKAKDTMTGIS